MKKQTEKRTERPLPKYARNRKRKRLVSLALVGEEFDNFDRIVKKRPPHAMVLAWCLVRESLSELVKLLPETGQNDASYDAAVENAKVLHKCRAIDEQILQRVTGLDELSAYACGGVRTGEGVSTLTAKGFVKDAKTVLNRLLFLLRRGAVIPGEEGNTVSIDKAKRSKLIGRRAIFRRSDLEAFRELGLDDSQAYY
jgi:hypothetical protein